jgi:hypothetical protein
MSDVVPAEKVIKITETAAVLVRACHHYQVRRVIGPRFTGIERGANIHRWAKSDGREKRKSNMHWISPNGFSHAEAQTKYPKREYIKLFHTETPLASHSKAGNNFCSEFAPTGSANDLFSFRIEKGHFIQVELDDDLFIQLEEMFAMDSGDHVTGT